MAFPIKSSTDPLSIEYASNLPTHSLRGLWPNQMIYSPPEQHSSWNWLIEVNALSLCKQCVDPWSVSYPEEDINRENWVGQSQPAVGLRNVVTRRRQRRSGPEIKVKVVPFVTEAWLIQRYLWMSSSVQSCTFSFGFEVLYGTWTLSLTTYLGWQDDGRLSVNHPGMKCGYQFFLARHPLITNLMSKSTGSAIDYTLREGVRAWVIKKAPDELVA